MSSGVLLGGGANLVCYAIRSEIAVIESLMLQPARDDPVLQLAALYTMDLLASFDDKQSPMHAFLKNSGSAVLSAIATSGGKFARRVPAWLLSTTFRMVGLCAGARAGKKFCQRTVENFRLRTAEHLGEGGIRVNDTTVVNDRDAFRTGVQGGGEHSRIGGSVSGKMDDGAHVVISPEENASAQLRKLARNSLPKWIGATTFLGRSRSLFGNSRQDGGAC